MARQNPRLTPIAAPTAGGRGWSFPAGGAIGRFIFLFCLRRERLRGSPSPGALPRPEKGGSLSLPGTVLGILLLSGLLPQPALAGIGDLRPEALAKAQSQGMTLVRTDRRTGYSALTYHLSRPSSIPGAPAHDLTVREFFDAGGRSFAVAWKGSIRPDLPSLLGKLYSHLPTVNRTPNRHRFLFQDDRLVVTSIGTSRIHAGAAWDPTRLPSGLAPSRIRIAP